MSRLTLDQAIASILKGEVVAIPTETVYGLAAKFDHLDAVKKVFQLKGRPADNPLILHVSELSHLSQIWENEPEEPVFRLIRHFWPGPLTLIARKKSEVLDIISAGLPTVGVRMPNHPIAEQLIAATGPLAAPSANLSGRPSPTRVEHLQADYHNQLDFLDGGSCAHGLESTVLDVSRHPFVIYRPGHVAAKDIREVSGIETIYQTEFKTKPLSPGLKYSHYAPNARVMWMDESHQENADTLRIWHSSSARTENSRDIHYRGNYSKMAAELYDTFRSADKLGYAQISIEPFIESNEDESVLLALKNRIERAIG